MRQTQDTYRLIAAVEDLAEGFYEANRLRAKEHREILDRLAELTPAKVAENSAVSKILPWLVAIASAVAEAIHRYGAQ